MTPDVCSSCGAKGLEIVQEPAILHTDDGTKLSFRDEFTRCGACENDFYTHEQSLAHSASRTAALRKHEGLLSPEEIRGIREFYGFAQHQLETLLRVGQKCVTRWERGLIRQSRAVDQLLVVFRDYPEVVYDLCDELGVPVDGYYPTGFEVLPDFEASQLRTRISAEWKILKPPTAIMDDPSIEVVSANDADSLAA